MPDNRRVRAPKLADITSSQSQAALLSMLLVSGDPTGDVAMVTDFLDRAAPLLSLDLNTECPHCQSKERVRFDLARYLAKRVSGERIFLVRETHLIASHYGWHHEEIMDLSRTDRRAYARLIEAEGRFVRRARRVP